MMRRKFMISVPMLFCVSLCNSVGAGAIDSDQEYLRSNLAPPAITIRVVGEKELVISAEEHTCPGMDEWGGKLDIPDAPLRAFRDPTGRVWGVAAHYNNILYATRDLAKLARSGCRSVFASKKSGVPSDFADRSWVVSPAVLPSGDIFGLVHNEYWGGLHDLSCRLRLGRRDYWASVCLYVNLTGVTAKAGGAPFELIPGPQRVVAAYPYRFSRDMSRNGVRDPTNIFRNPEDGIYYFLASVDHQDLQKRGMCLFRSRYPDADPWLAWDGKDFKVRLESPYVRPASESPTVCMPVSALDFTTVVFSISHKIFIGFGQEERIRPGGAFYRTSPDLIHWSAPRFLLEGHSFEFWQPGQRMMAYASILDPTDTSPNFDRVSDKLFIYYQSVRATDGKHLAGRERDIVRMPLQIGP